MNSLKQRITLGRLLGFTLTMLCLGLIIYTLGNQTLLIKINHLLSEFNINSRTLILLINDNLGQSSGREGIYSFLIEKIKEQPLLGYGIGSDRMMLGMYAHNLFLALFTFFGVIGGILSSLLIMFILFAAFVATKNQKSIVILTVFFSIYFVSSMVSGDILTNYGPWILLGLSINIISSKYKFSYRVRKPNVVRELEPNN
jgi:O-antigen ligase